MCQKLGTKTKYYLFYQRSKSPAIRIKVTAMWVPRMTYSRVLHLGQNPQLRAGTSSRKEDRGEPIIVDVRKKDVGT